MPPTASTGVRSSVVRRDLAADGSVAFINLIGITGFIAEIAEAQTTRMVREVCIRGHIAVPLALGDTADGPAMRRRP